MGHARAFGLRDMAVGNGWFAATTDSEIILAFRGTQILCFADWKADFKAKLVQSVHEGFALRLAAIGDDVQHAIASLSNSRRDMPVYVAGHSLGAAVATLAARELRRAGQWVAGAYLYGCPRVGGVKFALEYHRLGLAGVTFRHRNCCDIVPHVPPAGWFGGFKHVGKEVYYDMDASPWFGLPWRYRLIDMLAARVGDTFTPGSRGIKDHAVAQYVKITRPKSV